MKVKTIKVSNFRGIDNLEIPFDGKSTIIFGINGVGKSTMLRAIDLIYANIIALLVSSKRRLAQLEYDDISHGKTIAEIEAVFEFSDGSLKRYFRSISRFIGRRHNVRELKELVGLFEEYYLEKGYDDGNGNWIEEEDLKNMPVFVNYGVNRSVFDVPLRASKNQKFTRANPQLSNPLEGERVVLIDELDLHMHTSWQRRVMQVLQKTFPNIQFIITTHSPQILGELDGTFNLFYMFREEGKTNFKQYESFMGWDANVILEEAMDTPSVNLEIKQLIAQMYEYISDKRYDQAEEIADQLDEISNGYVDGKIHSLPRKVTTNIAQEMINHMGLDSFHLERNRRKAIESSEVFDEEEYSNEDIRDFIEFYSNKDNGMYVPYCMAIVDCLKDRLV